MDPQCWILACYATLTWPQLWPTITRWMDPSWSTGTKAGSAGIQTDSPSPRQPRAQTMFFCRALPGGAQQIRDSAESEHCPRLNGAARSEKLRNKVLKTFELNNRMKLYTPSGRQETKLDSNNLVEFLNHLNIFYRTRKMLKQTNQTGNKYWQVYGGNAVGC